MCGQFHHGSYIVRQIRVLDLGRFKKIELISGGGGQHIVQFGQNVSRLHVTARREFPQLRGEMPKRLWSGHEVNSNIGTHSKGNATKLPYRRFTSADRTVPSRVSAWQEKSKYVARFRSSAVATPVIQSFLPGRSSKLTDPKSTR